MVSPSGNVSYDLLNVTNATFFMDFTQESNDSQLVDQGKLTQLKFQVGITQLVVWKILVPIIVPFGVHDVFLRVSVYTY